MLSALISRMCIAGGNTEIFGSGVIIRLFNTCYFFFEEEDFLYFFSIMEKNDELM